MQRRDFLKLSATAGAVSCVTACGGKSGESVTPVPPEKAPILQGRSACLPNCGLYCPMTTKVQDGRLIGVDIDPGNGDKNDPASSRPCLRGRASVQRNYQADRILYPMKRVGPRGSGEFKRISWEQAISEISAKLKAYYDERSDGRGILLGYGYVGQSTVNNKWALEKVLHDCGGVTTLDWGYSFHQVMTSHFHMFGAWWSNDVANYNKVIQSCSSMSEAQHSDLIVSFGFNPSETALGGYGQGYVFNKIRQNTPTIFLDPKYTDSVLGFKDAHHFIRPGTDAALCEAMAYVLIAEDGEAQIDKAFLKEKCYGYDAEPETPNMMAPGTMLPPLPYKESYKAHILGEGSDGTPAKTPEWAAPICGIPADTIRQLARRIASAKAPYICAGYGMQRHINGEDQAGALAVFGCLIGAVGKRGTNAGTTWAGPMPVPYPIYFKHKLDPSKQVFLNFFQWTKAIKDGKNVTVHGDALRLPAEELDETGNGNFGTNVKIIFTHGGNSVNQHSDSNRTRKLISDESLIDMHVVIENHMTATAKLADYLLPDATVFERKDILGRNGGYNTDTIMWSSTKNELKPLGEAKPTFEIARLLAAAMGVEESLTGGLSYDETLEKGYQDCVKYHIDNHPMLKGAPQAPESYQAFREQETWSFEVKNELDNESSANYHCALYDFVQNGTPLSTTTGKIGIYKHSYAMIADRPVNKVPDVWPDPQGRYINAIPKYTVAAESYQDKSERFDDYPLQCISCHGKGQAHSFYWSVPWVRESSEHCVWVNAKDAPAGCQSGDLVIVESLRGKIQIRLKITPRMMPGVISLPQGAWYNPQKNGVDTGGCMNTLTQWELPCAVGKGNPQQTNRVKIYKA